MSAAVATKKPTEPQWDGVVRRSAEIEVKAIDEDSRSVEVVASTDTLDSYGDVVDQTWDLKRYRKNPVVLWAHNAYGMFDGSRPEDFIPIGKAEGIRIHEGKLVARLVFAPAEVRALAEQVYQGFRQGFIRAVSVGFRPGKVTKETDEDGKTFLRLAKNELWEISAVPIPANPDAVAKAAAIERSGLARLASRNATRKRIMDPEQLLEEANKALERKTAELTALSTRATEAETALAAERTVSKKLELDLTAANTQIVALSAKVTELESDAIKTTLDSLQGVKFAPAEREDLDAMVKGVGIDRVKSYLEKRPDLALIASETKGAPITITKGAPPEVPSDDPSADLVKAANERTKVA